jgi:hypothetical protein
MMRGRDKQSAWEIWIDGAEMILGKRNKTKEFERNKTKK